MQRRAAQLTIGYDPQWRQQSAWDVPNPGTNLTKAFPATSRNYLDIDETIEDIDDCTGENLLLELVTAKVARLNIDFDVDPDVLAGLAAFGYGVAASPSGGTNEVQLETLTATGGSRRLTVQVGANAQTTPDVPFNASAATIQAALEALSNVGTGDIVVSNTGTNTNEVQTETIDGTVDGGTRTLRVTNPVTGVVATTAPIAWNASAGAIQTALEALANVDVNDIIVAGSGPYTYTFSGINFKNANVALIVVNYAALTAGGVAVPNGSVIVQTTPGVLGTRTYSYAAALQKQDVNLLTVNTYALTGGTSTFSTTTPGIGETHEISRLSGYTLPLMTLYLGFRGSSDQPVIFKNVVVNNFRVRSISRAKVTCSVELIGSGDLEYAVGYSMPDCQDIVPIRFGDCAVSVGGVDFVAQNIAREFEYYFQNDVNPKFDGPGIYATRHERADKRPSQISVYILGEPGDPFYELARARTYLDSFIQCGPTGRNIKFIAPGAIVKLASPPIRFGGDPPESEIALIARPKKTIGDATTPTHVTAVIGTSATLLTPAT